MNVELFEDYGGKVLTVCGSDKLYKADYEHFVPEIERLIKQHGRIRVLFDIRDFCDWTTDAAGEDFKFDLKHFRDIQRLAVVGERPWEKWMATFCSPFTTATIRYFERSNAEEAQEWINQDLPVVATRSDQCTDYGRK